MAFDPKKFIAQAEADIRKRMGKEHAITAVSGGVDSFVAATLAARAVPGQLHVVYVDNGLMRKNETERVKEVAVALGVDLKAVDARKRFLEALRGVVEPEAKRKIIGE